MRKLIAIATTQHFKIQNPSRLIKNFLGENNLQTA